MLTPAQHTAYLESLLKTLELPDSAYEKAESRYQDLGKWLGQPTSSCANFSPHVFSQGSFLLGTAIRPLKADDAYDLDLACSLESGVTKGTHTQQALKLLVKSDLEAYRKARGISTPTGDKHRCLRIEYLETPSFHMDVVPAIPADDARKQTIKAAMLREHVEEAIASKVSHLAINITDDRHPQFRALTNDWLVSNPRGYAEWFRHRMKPIEQKLLLERVGMFKAASVDELPMFRWKVPLQRCIQILKRHRDQMYQDSSTSDLKPISIIITTLAAKAYRGEADLGQAMTSILDGMAYNTKAPRVPNPVNPEEDFADKWRLDLRLKDNFDAWLEQARTDLKRDQLREDETLLAESAMTKFSAALDPRDLRTALGITGAIAAQPRATVISSPSKPWGGANPA